MDETTAGQTAKDAPDVLTSPTRRKLAGDVPHDVTADVTEQSRQSVAAMLLATYAQLDRLERLLGGTGTASASPSPSTQAALVTALQVVAVVNGNLQERDFTGIAVLERVQTNLRAVMGTVGALLCDLTLPGAAGEVDLAVVVEQARTVLDAFSADPASSTPLGTTA